MTVLVKPQRVFPAWGFQIERLVIEPEAKKSPLGAVHLIRVESNIGHFVLSGSFFFSFLDPLALGTSNQ